MNSKLFSKLWMTGLAAAALLGETSEAGACGGFFCSQNQPVNQAAERIVFADNGDGTVTAVIQILYQGGAPDFSWILPISTVPTADTIAVASNLGFQRLQARTNPQYSLTLRVEGSCKPGPPSTGGATSFGGTSSFGGSGGRAGVVVEASGTVGAFDWTAISLDPSLSDPADAAVTWLEDNGYSVVPGTPGLIRPYLADGLYLLALRLTKGADTGSIRPIVLTYEASRPMIPIKLTAVAANDDMGVMTWLLASSRGVPQNYLSLELNEAKVNWFNANSNYNAVVTAAADEAGGQGFVTEFAAHSDTLANVVWTSLDESQWQSFQGQDLTSFQQAFDASYFTWGAWDGFWDAVRDVAKLPADLTLAAFQKCPSCSQGQVVFKDGLSASDYVLGLNEKVIRPVKDMQALFDAHGYVTRLYTTLSAQEMTVDPLFAFNPDLPAVSNLHSAERVIECSPELYQTEAPWRVELPQGVVRGTGAQAQNLSWPAFASQPANSRIVRLATSGPGVVLEDNTQVIREQLDEYGVSLGSGGTAAAGTGGQAPQAGRATGGAAAGSNAVDVPSGGGGCSLSHAGNASALAVATLAGLALARRRRRGRASA